MRRSLAVAALAGLLAACGGPNSPDTEAASASAPAGPVEIEYVIHGTTTQANVTMRTGTGSRQDDITLPDRGDERRSTFTFSTPAGERLYLSAQNANSSGVIRCTIVDSQGRTISSNESTGGYSIATCEGEAR